MSRVLIATVVFLTCAGTGFTQDTAFLTQKLAQENRETLADDVQRFGDAARGAIAFYNPNSTVRSCHQANGSGRRLGPDLTEKRDVTTQHLIESILHPSAKIKEGFETVAIQDLDGNLISGILLSQTENELVVDRIEQPEKPLRINLEDVEEWKKTKLSTMPEALANQLADRNQFLDLIAYLRRLADEGPAAESELKPANVSSLRPLPEYESR